MIKQPQGQPEGQPERKPQGQSQGKPQGQTIPNKQNVRLKEEAFNKLN